LSVVCISRVVPSGKGIDESALFDAADATAGMHSATAIITPAPNDPTPLLKRFTISPFGAANRSPRVIRRR
jgi:hypothetical protein